MEDVEGVASRLCPMTPLLTSHVHLTATCVQPHEHRLPGSRQGPALSAIMQGEPTCVQFVSATKMIGTSPILFLFLLNTSPEF